MKTEDKNTDQDSLKNSAGKVPVNAIVSCGFDEAWIGKCKSQKPCEKHNDLKCCACGEKATHSCDSTGQFVCGAPLCDNCEHTIFEDGTNGGVGFDAQMPPEGLKAHCKKTDQVFKPCYAREEVLSS